MAQWQSTEGSELNRTGNARASLCPPSSQHSAGKRQALHAGWLLCYSRLLINTCWMWSRFKKGGQGTGERAERPVTIMAISCCCLKRPHFLLDKVSLRDMDWGHPVGLTAHFNNIYKPYHESKMHFNKASVTEVTCISVFVAHLSATSSLLPVSGYRHRFPACRYDSGL